MKSLYGEYTPITVGTGTRTKMTFSAETKELIAASQGQDLTLQKMAEIAEKAGDQIRELDFAIFKAIGGIPWEEAYWRWKNGSSPIPAICAGRAGPSTTPNSSTANRIVTKLTQPA